MSINITGIIGVSNINMAAASGPPPGPLGSVLFTGSGSNWSSLRTGSNAVLAMGTGSFTIECWFRTTEAGQAYICQTSDVGSSGGTAWWFGVSGNQLYLAAHGGGQPYSYCSFTPTTNTWYHIAGVRTPSQVYLFVNGISQSVTTSGSMTTQNFTDNTFNIGAISTPVTLNGNISNLRLSTGSLYTTNFSVPTAPLTSSGSTVLLMCQEPNSFADNGPNNLSFSAQGPGPAPVAVSANPFS